MTDLNYNLRGVTPAVGAGRPGAGYPPRRAGSASALHDPYGNVTAAAGPYASADPFRWSTKYWDAETGLGCWGQRYYDAALGRWLSRDPLDELGGVNLYAYAGNDPADRFDPFGEMFVPCPWWQTDPSRCRDNGQNGANRCHKTDGAQTQPTTQTQPRQNELPPCSEHWYGLRCGDPDLCGALYCQGEDTSRGFCVCICAGNMRGGCGGNGQCAAASAECAKRHEQYHASQGRYSCGPRGGLPADFPAVPDDSGGPSDNCAAFAETFRCLAQKVEAPSCGVSCACAIAESLGDMHCQPHQNQADCPPADKRECEKEWLKAVRIAHRKCAQG